MENIFDYLWFSPTARMDHPGGWDERHQRVADSSKSWIEDMTGQIRESLAENNISIDYDHSELRRYGSVSAPKNIHTDENYLTISYALRGPGTVIYAPDGAEFKQVRVPRGILGVFGGQQREAASGVHSIWHSSPLLDVPGRAALLTSYVAADPAVESSRPVAQRRIRQRQAQFQEFLRKSKVADPDNVSDPFTGQPRSQK